MILLLAIASGGLVVWTTERSQPLLKLIYIILNSTLLRNIFLLKMKIF